MEYVKLAEGKDVFSIGSQGDLFYLILQGVVEVKIPDPSNMIGFNEANK